MFIIASSPSGEPFKRRRALGVGLAAVLSTLTAERGFGLDVLDYTPPVDDLLAALESDGLDLDRRLVGGVHHLEQPFFVELVVVEAPHAREVARRRFTFTPEQAVSPWADDVVAWLKTLGPPGGGAGPAVRARTMRGVILEAWMTGVEWLLGQVPSVADAEFLEALRDCAGEMAAQLGDAWMVRRIRPFIASIVPEMAAKRAPTGTDAVSAALRGLAARVDPAGMEYLWPVLDAGLAQGADVPAWRACRAQVLLALGRTDEAAEELDLLRSDQPLDASLGMARSFIQTGQWKRAVELIDETLALSEGNEPFIDITQGPEAWGAGVTWRGILLAVRGEAELGAKQFKNAERTLREALEAGTNEALVLRLLASTYRSWSFAEADEKHSESARVLLRKHLEYLDRVFALDPSPHEVRAALDVVHVLNDPSLEETWIGRARMLSGG
jgi:tetratricopeptide (TPR) repeat protein